MYLDLSDYFNSTDEALSFFREALPDVIIATGQELEGIFTPLELRVIIFAMSNVEIIPCLAGSIIFEECRDYLRFNATPLYRNLSINRFLVKLSKLTAFQSLVLGVWAKRYWELCQGVPELEVDSYIVTLQVVDRNTLH